MKLKANFMYKPGNFQMDDCQVEKVVELSYGEFSALVTAPLVDQPFISENKEFMFSKDGVTHCLLALGQGHPDGVLIDSEGHNFARHAAYLTGARAIVNAKLEQAADYIIRQGARSTTTGSWAIHANELKKELGLTVRKGNGLDQMLLDALARRDEVSDVRLTGDCIAATYHPRFCKHLRREEDYARFSLERTAELFSNAMTTILQRHGNDELYAMLHDDFGMTLQEIREHGYLADSTLAEIGALPRLALEDGLRVRDVLQLDTPCDVFLDCGAEYGHIPLDVFNKLTVSGRETYAALLDAEVSDIRGTGMEIELTLDGVTQEELIQFYEDYKSHQWAEDHMTMYM